MLSWYRLKKSEQRLVEEKLYEIVASELLNGTKRIGLWTKALGDSEGSSDKAESLYIQYRVQSLKDEATVINEVLKTLDITENKSPSHPEKIETSKPNASLRNEQSKAAPLPPSEPSKNKTFNTTKPVPQASAAPDLSGCGMNFLLLLSGIFLIFLLIIVIV